MAQIKGKQIKNKSITNLQIGDDAIDSGNIVNSSVNQSKLNLTDPLLDADASTKKYTDDLVVSSISIERSSDSNLGMIAEDTSLKSLTDGISIGCLIPVLQDSVVNTVIEVYVNGVKCGVGDDKECFFSPDGEIIRKVNDVRIGDKLYWNSVNAGYDLDINDIIDFKFLTNNKQIEEVVVDADGTHVVNNEVTLLKYTGVENNSESGYVFINGVNFRMTYTFVVDTWYFTFDYTGTQEHIFTELDESVDIVANGIIYSIRWSGVGSTYVTIAKHGISDNSYGPLKTTVRQELINNGFSAEGQVLIRGDWMFIPSADDNVLIILKRINNEYIYHQDFAHTTLTPQRCQFDFSGTKDRFTLLDTNLYIYDLNIYTDQWEATYLPALNISNGSVFTYNNDLYFSDTGIIKHYKFNGTNWVYHADIIYGGSVTGQTYSVVDDSNMIVTSSTGFLHFIDAAGTWTYNETLALTNGLTSGDIAHSADDTFSFSSNDNYFVFTNLVKNTEALLIFENTGSAFINTDHILLATLGANSGVSFSADAIITNDNTIYIPILDTKNDDLTIIPFQQTQVFELIDTTWTQTSYLPKASYIVDPVANDDRSDEYLVYDKVGDRLISTEFAKDVPYYEYGKSFINNYPTDRTIAPVVSSLSLEKNIENNSYYIDYSYSHPIGIEESLPKVYWKVTDHFNGLTAVLPEIGNSISKPIEQLDNKVVNYEIKPIDINNVVGDNAVGVLPTPKLIADNNNSEFVGSDVPLGPTIKLTIVSGSLVGHGPGVYYLQGEQYEQSKNLSTYGFYNASNNLSISIFMKVRPSVSSYSLTFWVSDGINSTSTGLSGTADAGDFDKIDQIFQSYTIGANTFTIEKSGGWCPLLRDDRV